MTKLTLRPRALEEEEEAHAAEASVGQHYRHHLRRQGRDHPAEAGLLQIVLAGGATDLGVRGGPEEEGQTTARAGDGSEQRLLLEAGAERCPVEADGDLPPMEAEAVADLRDQLGS